MARAALLDPIDIGFGAARMSQPVQYVKICSLYGVGFYYIPGTDMCIKVGGWARYETGVGYAGSFTTEWFNNNVNNRNTIGWHQRSKGVISVDARSPTAYGTVRSYVDVGVSSNVTGVNDGSLGAQGYINRWFIQWAGFTIGHSTSFFDFYSIGANQYGFVSAGSDTGDGGWTVFAYTANFGNGFSASISAEVSVIRRSSTPARCRALGAPPAGFNQGPALSGSGHDCGRHGLRGATGAGSGRQSARRPGLGLGSDHGRVASGCRHLLRLRRWKAPAIRAMRLASRSAPASS